MTVSRTICLGFLAMISIGTLLLMLPFATSSGEWNNFLVAFFTATSAVCVTGLIVVDTGTYFSPLGEFIILLLIQVGGLGYMTATTFLLIILGRKLGLRDRLAVQQCIDILPDDARHEIVNENRLFTALHKFGAGNVWFRRRGW